MLMDEIKEWSLKLHVNQLPCEKPEKKKGTQWDSHPHLLRAEQPKDEKK